MPFSFKQFHIEDTRCGMPVSTDGVLLGAWAPLDEAHNILDIGAGSGLLSLMAAQRSEAAITAIELDDSAALDCQYNFSHSQWNSRLSLVTGAIQQHCTSSNNQAYDHIICNPPYFESGPQSNSQLRAKARHTDSLSFAELLNAIRFLLSANGQASLILPTQAATQLLSLLAKHQLHCVHTTAVASVEGKQPNRQLLLLQTDTANSHDLQQQPSSSSMAIRMRDGSYTAEFIQLSKNFYLKL